MRSAVMVAALVLAMTPVATSAAPQAYKIGENGVKAPVLIREVKPNYTEGAKARQVQGVVELECVVRTDGTVDDDVRVTKSLDSELDQQAITALKQWRFRPGTKDDKPVPVEVNVEMTFTLR